MGDPKNQSFTEFMQQSKTAAPSFTEFMQPENKTVTFAGPGGVTQTGTIESDPSLLKSLWSWVKHFGLTAGAGQAAWNPENADLVRSVYEQTKPKPAENRKVMNNADVIGGAVGGVVGGVPGAIVGGAGGQLAKQGYRAKYTNYEVPATPAAAAGDVALAGGEQGLFQLIGNMLPAWLRVRALSKAGQLSDGTLKTFVRGTVNPETLPTVNNTAVPQWVRDYLQTLPRNSGERPITLTAGELSAPGFIKSAEPVIAKTATANSVVNRFLTNRQKVLERNAGRMLADLLPPGEAPLPSLAGNIQQRAADAMREVAESRSALQEAIAQQFAGRGPMLPSDAGKTVAEAVTRYNSAIDALEKQLYESGVMVPASQRGVRVEWSTAAPLAQEFIEEADKAKQAGGTTVPSEILDRLRTIAGGHNADALADATDLGYTSADAARKALGDKVWNEIVNSPAASAARPSGAGHEFSAATEARSALMQLSRRLEAQGLWDSNANRVVSRINEAMTKDLESALPNDLLQQWRAARKLTTEQKSLMKSPLLAQISNPQKTIAPESIVSRILKRGDETEIGKLMGVIEKSPTAIDATRRSAMDFIAKQGSPQKMVEAVEMRPGFRSIFGEDGYNNLIAVLRSEAQAATAPERVTYQAFLKNVAQAQQPEQAIRRALKSPMYANRLAELTAGDASLSKQVSWSMLEQVLNDSTKGGQFGRSGATFDPVLFSRNLREAMPALSKFGDREALRNLSEFADAIQYLHLTHQAELPAGQISAHWQALQTIGALGGIYETAVRTLAHEPLAAIGSATLGTATVLSPRLLIKLMLNPTGARLLAEGSRIPPTATGQVYANLLRLGEVIKREMSNDEEGQGTSYQVPALQR